MTVEVPLANGRGVALVDDEDADLVTGLYWYLDRHGRPDGVAHAATRLPDTKALVRMHRLILGPPAGIQVDHRNGNGLDNRRANLRLATDRQNKGNAGLRSNNTSGFKGVTWCRQTNRWKARIGNSEAGSRGWLGRFATAEDAARAYDAAAVEFFGEFAILNFPEAPL